MKHTTKLGKRLLSLLIALMMCMSMLPVSAFAAEGDPSEASVETAAEPTATDEVTAEPSAPSDETDSEPEGDPADNPSAEETPDEGSEPAEETASDEETTNDTPTEEAAEGDAPTEEVITDGTLADEATEDGTTTEEVITDGTPADEATEDNTPTDEVTEDGTPADEATEDGTPADEVTEDGTPADEATEGGAPTEEVITDGTPADEAVAEVVPTEPETAAPSTDDSYIEEDEDDDDDKPAEPEKVEESEPEASEPVTEPVSEPEPEPKPEPASEPEPEPESAPESVQTTFAASPMMSKMKFATAPAAEPAPAAAPASTETVAMQETPVAPTLLKTVADAAVNAVAEVGKTIVKTWKELVSFFTEKAKEKTDTEYEVELETDLTQNEGDTRLEYGGVGGTETANPTARIKLNLNGHTITLYESLVVRGSLTIEDTSKEKTGTIIGSNRPNEGDTTYKGGILIGSKGEVTLESGTIQGKDGAADNGIGVEALGKFTMNGGTITGFNNGGVSVGSKGEFTMTDGTITNNTKTGNGAGVEVKGGTFTMSGGLIGAQPVKGTGTPRYNEETKQWEDTTGHLVDVNGYLINPEGQFVDIKDGKDVVLGNTLTLDDFTTAGGGGGVAVINGGKFTLDGGTISGNNTTHGTLNRDYGATAPAASNGGGGVFVGGNSTFELKDGSITSNKSDTEGGGVFVSSGSDFIMSGGDISKNSASIEKVSTGGKPANSSLNGYPDEKPTSWTDENMSGGRGGGVYIHGTDIDNATTFTFTNGTISDNNAAKGGGIYIDARGAGDNMGQNTSIFSMGSETDISSRPVVSGNVAHVGEGGGIYIDSYSTGNHIYSGNIENNKTLTQWDLGGGGLYVNDASYLHMQNVIVTGNHANGLGGGLASCVNGNTVINDQNGMAIYNNHLDNKYGDDPNYKDKDPAVSQGHSSTWAPFGNGYKIDAHHLWKDKQEMEDFLKSAFDVFIASCKDNKDAGAYFSSTMLNGSNANWTGWNYESNSDIKFDPRTGEALPSDSTWDTGIYGLGTGHRVDSSENNDANEFGVYAQRLLGMTSNPSETDLAWLQNLIDNYNNRITVNDVTTETPMNRVYISGNISGTHGGGIGNNGTLVIGNATEPGSQKASDGIDFNIQKKLTDSEGKQLDLKDGQFTFELYDENPTAADNKNKEPLYTTSNGADGTTRFAISNERLERLFADAAPDAESVEVTYYIWEKKSGGDGTLNSGLNYDENDITFDKVLYKVTFKVTKNNKTLGGTTFTYYNADLESVERADTKKDQNDDLIPVDQWDPLTVNDVDKVTETVKDKDGKNTTVVIKNPFKFNNTVNTFDLDLSKAVNGAEFTGDDGKTLKFANGKWTIVDKDGNTATEWTQDGKKVTINADGSVSGLDTSFEDKYGNTIAVNGDNLSITESSTLKFRLYYKKDGTTYYFTEDGKFVPESDFNGDLTKADLTLSGAKLSTNREGYQSLLKNHVFYLKEVSAPGDGYVVDPVTYVIAKDENAFNAAISGQDNADLETYLENLKTLANGTAKDNYNEALRTLAEKLGLVKAETDPTPSYEEIKAELEKFDYTKSEDFISKQPDFITDKTDGIDWVTGQLDKMGEEDKKALKDTLELGEDVNLDTIISDYTTAYTTAKDELEKYGKMKTLLEEMNSYFKGDDAEQKQADVKAYLEVNTDAVPGLTADNFNSASKEQRFELLVKMYLDKVLRADNYEGLSVTDLVDLYKNPDGGKDVEGSAYRTYKEAATAYAALRQAVLNKFTKDQYNQYFSIDGIKEQADSYNKLFKEIEKNYYMFIRDDKLSSDNLTTGNWNTQTRLLVAFKNYLKDQAEGVDPNYPTLDVELDEMDQKGFSEIDVSIVPDEPEPPDRGDPEDPETPDTPETPETPEPPDEPTPMSELPEEEPPLAEMPDEETPLSEMPDEEVPLVELPEDPVPLANVPLTGDASMIWLYLTLLFAGSALIGLRKKEESEG